MNDVAQFLNYFELAEFCHLMAGKKWSGDYVYFQLVGINPAYYLPNGKGCPPDADHICHEKSGSSTSDLHNACNKFRAYVPKSGASWGTYVYNIGE